MATIVQDVGASHSSATISQYTPAHGAGVNVSGCINQSGSNDLAVIREDNGNSGVVEINQIAGGTGRGAYVRQSGANGRVTVTQSQAVGATALESKSRLDTLLGVVGNSNAPALDAAIVFQTGADDIATVEQRAGASGSYAEISQVAKQSVASIVQDDTLTTSVIGNFASILQQTSTSTGDTATISQDGDNNYAALTQNGSNLTGSIDQTYDNNTAALTQTGSNLSYAIAQNGVSTSVSANGAAPIVLTTSGGANSISVSVAQTASGATVTVN